MAAELNNLGRSPQQPASSAPGPSSSNAVSNSTPLVVDDSDDEDINVDRDGTLQVSGPSRPL